MKSEARIQQECFIWFWNKYPEYRKLLFAVPNGGARSTHEGKLLKQQGVVAGVSDMLFMIDGRCYCFELKTKIGVQSSRQKDWQYRVESQGFKYYIVRSLRLFQEIIESIIKHHNPQLQN